MMLNAPFTYTAVYKPVCVATYTVASNTHVERFMVACFAWQQQGAAD
jgi:hypothetical protein